MEAGSSFAREWECLTSEKAVRVYSGESSISSSIAISRDGAQLIGKYSPVVSALLVLCQPDCRRGRLL